MAQDLGIDLGLLLELCASRPFRLDEAIENGSATVLESGEERSWWVELESLGAA